MIEFQQRLTHVYQLLRNFVYLKYDNVQETDRSKFVPRYLHLHRVLFTNHHYINNS